MNNLDNLTSSEKNRTPLNTSDHTNNQMCDHQFTNNCQNILYKYGFVCGLV